MANDDSTVAPRRQIMLIGGAAFAGAVVIFLLWYLLVRTSFAPAFTGINSTDALTITQELDRLKTPYELADNGATIMVPQDKVDEARVNILGSELPLKGAVGFELFNKTDMGVTEFAQKINYQRALQGELARTIMALDQIETARVHLSLPEKGIFEQDRRPAKASITIATKIGGDIDDRVVRGIQQLVAAAVPDLRAADVAILDARGQLLSLDFSEFESVAETLEQQRRQAYEQSFASKIEDAIRAAGIAIPMKVTVTALRAFDDANETNPDDRSLIEGQKTTATGDDKRDHALNIKLQLASAPGSTVQGKLLAYAREAIDYNQSVGDAVVIQINPMVEIGDWPDEPAKATRRRSDLAPVAQTTLIDNLPLWPILAGLFLIALLIAAIRFRQSRAVPLSAEEKEAFADRLKSLIDNETGNGRQPV